MMITLQPFTAADFERLILWANSAELLLQFAGTIFSFPLTEPQLENYLHDVNRFAFKVVDTKRNKIVGHCEYFISGNVSKISRVLIGEETDRGKGFGEQIINQLLQLSLQHPAIIMAELNVYDWNTAAIKCYEKVGFAINPNKKSVAEVNGKTWTALNMTISKMNRCD